MALIQCYVETRSMEEGSMVLALQLLTVALCGGFLFAVTHDWATTNISLARYDVQDLTILLGRESRRADSYPAGYFSKHHAAVAAAKYLLSRAEARLERLKARGF